MPQQAYHKPFNQSHTNGILFTHLNNTPQILSFLISSTGFNQHVSSFVSAIYAYFFIVNRSVVIIIE